MYILYIYIIICGDFLSHGGTPFVRLFIGDYRRIFHETIQRAWGTIYLMIFLEVICSWLLIFASWWFDSQFCRRDVGPPKSISWSSFCVFFGQNQLLDHWWSIPDFPMKYHHSTKFFPYFVRWIHPNSPILYQYLDPTVQSYIDPMDFRWFSPWNHQIYGFSPWIFAILSHGFSVWVFPNTVSRTGRHPWTQRRAPWKKSCPKWSPQLGTVKKGINYFSYIMRDMSWYNI